MALSHVGSQMFLVSSLLYYLKESRFINFMQMAKLYAGEVPNFSEKDSRPYKWAQHLAGIDFLPEVPLSVGDDSNRASRSADLSSGLALYRQQNRAQTILQRIRSRKVAQMALT
jgi:THO complex subunit 5